MREVDFMSRKTIPVTIYCGASCPVPPMFCGLFLSCYVRRNHHNIKEIEIQRFVSIQGVDDTWSTW